MMIARIAALRLPLYDAVDGPTSPDCRLCVDSAAAFALATRAAALSNLQASGPLASGGRIAVTWASASADMAPLTITLLSAHHWNGPFVIANHVDPQQNKVSFQLPAVVPGWSLGTSAPSAWPTPPACFLQLRVCHRPRPRADCDGHRDTDAEASARAVGVDRHLCVEKFDVGGCPPAAARVRRSGAAAVAGCGAAGPPLSAPRPRLVRPRRALQNCDDPPPAVPVRPK
ncbi:hypothetical protein GGX14DRAFT_610654 [Mycena pura]|uniref:Uncharacterized protein n=1 Tax=Mycena pura TaxID=153505 RepID=A0AAD6VIY0_9AGAR|nr:hypothetical protein GGX14DRAFT_610654 [Mycena pura]